MEAERHHILARRAPLAAPTMHAGFEPRTRDGRLIRPRLLASAIACIFPAATMAGPQGEQVVAGQSTITRPDAKTTIIHQSTQKSAINWQSFSIGGQEYVQFIQPNSSSISLNRVIGGNPSSILGSLSANGQIYLVNPNGIYFGHDARVDVSGIVASVLDITDHDFMSGNYVFQASVDENLGTVVNEGIINARNEGYVVLMGNYTENNGVVQAHMGKVVLASGSHVTMDISGNNLIRVAVDEATVANLAGVKNSGEIYADGGRVIMTAKVARDLVGNAVNNEGLVRASSIVEKDGAIFLTGSGGDVVNSGTLDASAADGSNVDGGGVLVYSDRDVTLSSGAAIHARGDGDGAGGVVRVIAEETLDFQQGADIAVQGSPHSGGFVEVSGHGGLKMRGGVHLGSGGTLLIDPSILTLKTGADAPGGGSETSASVGVDFISGLLAAGNDVHLVASDSINASPGFKSINASGSGDGNLNLTIGTVTVGGGTLGSSYLGTNNCNTHGVCLGLGTAGTMSVTPDSNGNIRLGNVSFNLAGNLNVAAGTSTGSVSLGNVNAANLQVSAGAGESGSVSVGSINVDGNVMITAADTISFNGRVQRAAGGLTASAGGDIDINSSIGSGGTFEGAGLFNGSVNLSAGNDIDVDADILVGSHSVNLTADAGTPDGSGDINMFGRGGCTEGCFSENRTVMTRGSMTLRGENLNISGADFDFDRVTSNEDGSVRVSADGNVNVILSGRMNVRGGRAITEDNDIDVSAKVSAGNDVNITASGGLGVEGGRAEVSNTSGFFDQGSVDASAAIDAGRDLNIGIASSDLTVQGGTAFGIASGASTFYTATAQAAANAGMQAGRAVVVSSVGTNLNVQAGDATAVVDNIGSGCSACTAQAAANASIVGGTVAINNVGGDFNVSGGSVRTFVSGSNGSVDGSATALVQGSSVTVGAIGSINIDAGTTQVAGSWQATTGSGSSYGGGAANLTGHADALVRALSGNVSLNATAVGVQGGTVASGIASESTANILAGDDGMIMASARAQVSAPQDLIVVASNNLMVNGGNGTVNFNTISGSLGFNADASAKITAGRDMTLNVPGGDITVSGGDFFANASAEGVPSFLNVEADADGVISASRNLNIVAVGGDLSIDGGRARARASDSCTSCAADVSATAVVNGGASIQVSSVSNNLNIFGGTASAIGSGNTCTSCAATANAGAWLSGGSVTVSSVGGNLNVSGGDAYASLSETFVGAVATANAGAHMNASGNVSVNVDGTANVVGGDATADGFLFFADNVEIIANAEAGIEAGGDLNLAAGNGLNVVGGSASADPNAGSSTVGTASASAKAGLSAGGLATVSVTNGSVTLAGGFSNPGATTGSSYLVARASGTSGTMPFRRAYANGSVNANQLQVMAADDVFGTNASIDANGMYIAAGRNLHLYNTTVRVGNGVAPGVAGDPLVLEILELADLPEPPNGAPNLKFLAGTSMYTGQIETTTSNAYLWFEADDVMVHGISAPSGPLTVQYSPFTSSLEIIFEHEPPPPEDPPPLLELRPAGRIDPISYYNSEHVEPFPITTLVLGGSGQSGPMTVGANGPIDIGAKNILLLNLPENVNSAANIITTGLVATSGFVGLTGEEVFISPRLDSFEVEIETLWEEVEERKKQLVEAPEEEHGMCTAL